MDRLIMHIVINFNLALNVCSDQLIVRECLSISGVASQSGKCDEFMRLECVRYE